MCIATLVGKVLLCSPGWPQSSVNGRQIFLCTCSKMVPKSREGVLYSRQKIQEGLPQPKR